MRTRLWAACAALMMAIAGLPAAHAAPIPKELPTWVWLDACTSDLDLDCIEALGVVTPEGTFLPGRPTGYSRPNSVRGSKEIGQSGIYNGDGIHHNATWQLPGIRHEYGTEYVITEFTLSTGTVQWYDYPNDRVYPATGVASAGAAILPVPTIEGFANNRWGVPLKDFPHACVTQNYAEAMECQREANLDPRQVIRAVIRYSWYKAGSVTSHLRDNLYLEEPIPTGGTRVTIEGRPGERPYFVDSLALPRDHFKREKIDTLFSGWRVNSSEEHYSFSADECRSKGLPIITGNMYSAGTPVWNSSAGELSVNVWAPHYAPDGSVYRGYYEGTFPNDYISCMWKLRQEDVLSQFMVSVTQSDTSSPTVATMEIRKTVNGVRIAAANFEYSNETITFKTRSPVKTPDSATQTPVIEAVAKKSTITCTKGRSVMKVTRINPKCPSGWKRKK